MFEQYGDILTVKDIAEILSLHKNTVFKLIHNGDIPYMRVGHSIRVLRSDFITYLNNNSAIKY